MLLGSTRSCHGTWDRRIVTKYRQNRSLICNYPIVVRHESIRTRARRSNHIACCSTQGNGGDEAKLGPNVISSVKELREGVKWNQATVIRNDSSSFDGSVRLIHLSVADHVDVLYGRKGGASATPPSPKWIESYTMPGQFIALRFPPREEGGSSSEGASKDPRLASRLYSLASSPYESRRDSYNFDASIIEIVTDRNGSDDDRLLAELGPGALLEVSQVVGRGFSSLFSSAASVPTAIEEGRPMLLIASGTRGLAPMRALLNWTPVQAHATRHKIACLYVARTATTAAFLTGWDLWRDAGVNFTPLYTEIYDPELPANQQEVLDLLDSVMFLREGGFSSLAGPASSLTVLLSGVHGEIAAQLSKRLTAKGVLGERILFCDYF